MKKLLTTVALFATLITTSAFAEDRRLRVCNHTGKRITELYASNIDSGRWGSNILDDEGIVIHGHECVVVDLDPYSDGYCRLDLRVVRPDGAEATRGNANICVLDTWHINP